MPPASPLPALYSVYLSGRKAGESAYVERGPDKHVTPLGLIAEPKWVDAAQYRDGLIANADLQIPALVAKGVESFVVNTEQCWQSVTDGAVAVKAAMRTIRQRHKGVQGAYGAMADDSAAWAEPRKDQLTRNQIVAAFLLPMITTVEIDGYARRGADLKPETESGSAAVPVLRRIWHQVQQARLLYPGKGIRIWLSTQCLNNGLMGETTDIDAATLGKVVQYARALPGVTALVHFSELDQNAAGNVGGGLPLTPARLACRNAFALEGTRQ